MLDNPVQFAERDSNAVPGSIDSITRTAFFAPEILRNALDVNLLTAVRDHVMRAIDTVCEASTATRSTFTDQRGINLSDITSPAILLLTAQLQQITNLPCNLSKCSARQQFPDGEYQLRWHQDCAPMELQHGETGVVAWVPLDPINGTRPSLEIAEPVPAHDHVRDERVFLVIEGQEFHGKQIRGLAVGDIVLFSPYAPHRTYCSHEMSRPRLSLDIRFSNKWRV